MHTSNTDHDETKKPIKMPFTKSEIKVTKEGKIIHTQTTDELPLNRWVSIGGVTEHNETLDKVMKNYNKLFPIDGKVTDKQSRVINILRQIINEDFVAKERQITNQNLYDLLKEVL